MTPFTQQLWQNIEPIFQAITSHAFIKELADGRLSRKRFAFYLQQDALYLNEFAKVLSLAGLKAEQSDTRQLWLSFAVDAIKAEQGLHQHYFKKFHISPSTTPTLACSCYTNFLLAAAYTRPYAEIIAAVLPCFWIYHETGKFLAAIEHKPNPYAAWIEVYSGPEFAVSVQAAISLVEQAAQTADANTRARMLNLFTTAARMEWAFWDSAYALEDSKLLLV